MSSQQQFIVMLGKYYNPNTQFLQSYHRSQPSSPYSYWKSKRLAQKGKKQYQKKIFGQHYNYGLVGINKEKKYLLEEQRNTEIQRSNRMLFEKLQKIGQRGRTNGKNYRSYTQKEPEVTEMYPKMSRMQNLQQISSTYSPLQHLKKKSMQSNVKLQQMSKTNAIKQNLIFQGYKEIDQQVLFITIRYDSNSYFIHSEHGNVQHKIQIDLKDYKVLLREALKGHHLNIFGLLRFNGTILELEGGRTQQVNIVEHQQLLLPTVTHQVFEPKNRAYTS